MFRKPIVGFIFFLTLNYRIIALPYRYCYEQLVVYLSKFPNIFLHFPKISCNFSKLRAFQIKQKLKQLYQQFNVPYYAS